MTSTSKLRLLKKLEKEEKKKQKRRVENCKKILNTSVNANQELYTGFESDREKYHIGETSNIKSELLYCDTEFLEKLTGKKLSR